MTQALPRRRATVIQAAPAISRRPLPDVRCGRTLRAYGQEPDAGPTGLACLPVADGLASVSFSFDETALLLDEAFDASGQDVQCIVRVVTEASTCGGTWNVAVTDPAEA